MTNKGIADFKIMLRKERKRLRNMLRMQHPNEIELEDQQRRIAELKYDLEFKGYVKVRPSKYERN